MLVADGLPSPEMLSGCYVLKGIVAKESKLSPMRNLIAIEMSTEGFEESACTDPLKEAEPQQRHRF